MSWYIKKCLDTPIIIGGPAPTFDKKLSQEASPFDAICIGEGDLAIIEFIENYDSNLFFIFNSN